MKKGYFKGNAPIPPDLMRELEVAAALPDDQIDTSDPDAPEVLDWSGATRGRFYRPVKKQKTLRIDADVLAYFEAQGPGYLSRMNGVLRDAMLRGERGGPPAAMAAAGRRRKGALGRD